ncbi:MAG: hypothetical protein LBN31_10355 [Hungatella sp.]|jgi:hypothetical protein|nr:hypothetical protein [Hungatella sp.]
MDEKQLIALIEQVLDRIKKESESQKVQNKAYVILPENWYTQRQVPCIETFHLLQRDYHTVVVLPDKDQNAGAFCNANGCSVITRGQAVFPAEDFVTVFPAASRNLVVKTALCIQDDFETEWISQCFAFGQKVYMQKETPVFTGREPDAYRKKILSYYREAEAFGICFDQIPETAERVIRPVMSSSCEKKRIITTEDLKGLPSSGELRLHKGDIVTPLAAEQADELGINILYQ